MVRKAKLIIFVGVAAVVLTAAYLKGWHDGEAGAQLVLTKEAVASQKEADLSPVKARERDFYAPNSEDLGPDEIRVIALGTGMPQPRPFQAAACFLIELGNGDKFLFDIGDGSVERLFALQIPFDYLDKVFIGHLHADHFGDIGSLYVSGSLAGRHIPLRIWGPSGAGEKLGTKYAIDGMERMFTWDLAGRVGMTDTRGFQLEVNEFDFKKDQVIYDENGVKIHSFPAIHSIDGSVSFALEWKGMKVVFSSDTYPNKWFAKHAQGADLAIHECFIAVPDLVKKWRLTPEAALMVGTQIHTPPEAFGKVMSQAKPRMAVAYHFFKDYDTTAGVYERVRKTYDGPLSLAEDFMVWNVTKDKIRTRMAVIDEHVWNPPLATAAIPPDINDRKKLSEKLEAPVGYSPEIEGGKLEMDDVIKPIYEEASKALGREFKYPPE